VRSGEKDTREWERKTGTIIEPLLTGVGATNLE
jgi:hypothetical protein